MTHLLMPIVLLGAFFFLASRRGRRRRGFARLAEIQTRLERDTQPRLAENPQPEFQPQPWQTQPQTGQSQTRASPKRQPQDRQPRTQPRATDVRHGHAPPVPPVTATSPAYILGGHHSGGPKDRTAAMMAMMSGPGLLTPPADPPHPQR